MPSLTHEFLLSILSYDPESGQFIWRVRRSRTPAGSVAGIVDDGYVRIKICHKMYRAHRLAWFYVTGKWPVAEIDHKDLNSINNRWTNLREATHSQNNANRRKRPNGKSLFKGVGWNIRKRQWCAKITINKKSNVIGYFDDELAAHAAYRAVAIIEFGEFARLE